MKKLIFVSLCFFFTYSAFAQFDEAESQLRTQNADTIMGWKFGGKFNLDFSQAGFTNWAAGGDNAFTGIVNLSLYLNKIEEKSRWTNQFELGYGAQVIKKDYSKTDDKLRLISKYGYKATKNWYYSGLLDFKTQMAPGYNTDDSSIKISNFMAPAYLYLSAGMDFVPNENLSIFLSPLTYRGIIVLDEQLSAEGSFGLDPGQKFRTELGAYVKFFYKHELFKNVTFLTYLDLFSNYLENPQNIDVDWRVELDMKINNFLRASIRTHLIYDDDIKFAYDSTGDGTLDAEGPRVQFKEIIAVGLVFEF